MGVFSRVHRYRGVGQEANVINVEMYGTPVKSLFTTSKVFTLHRLIDITDDSENVIYHSKTKFPSILDKTDVTDADGNQIAHIERKFFSLHERHFINMSDGTNFELSNEIMHIIKDVTNIVGLGWQLKGNILGLNFELRDENGEVIAVIAQKMLSIHDKYCIDIYKPEHEKTVIAILVTLQHMIKDREAAASVSSSSSHGSN